MASQNPYQQFPEAAYAEHQAFQAPQVIAPYPDSAYPQTYPTKFFPDNQPIPPYPLGHGIPHHATDPLPYAQQPPAQQQRHQSIPSIQHPPAIELAAPLPATPPTSTSPAQLKQDEKLARKISNMDLREQNIARKPVSRPVSVHVDDTPIPVEGVAHSGPQYNTVPPMPVEPYQQQPIPNQRLRSSSSFSTISNAPPYTQQVYPQSPYMQSAQPYVQSSPHLSPAQTHQSPFISQAPPLPQRPATVYSNTLSPSPVATSPVEPAMDETALASYLETHRQVPLPPQWLLPAITTTYYGSFIFRPKTDWLETPAAHQWRTVRFSENGRKPTLPTFDLTFRTKGGSFRDPVMSWAMTHPSENQPQATDKKKKEKEKKEKHPWTYEVKRDRHTGVRRTETLLTPNGKDILTTYTHAKNYDSLNFFGPDGKSYKWVAHTRLKTRKGTRFDTLRHALFVSEETKGTKDPLYGRIVADHAYWDGHMDKNEVHQGIQCSGCKTKPIVGLRWKCKTCKPSKKHEVCEDCRPAKFSESQSCKFTLVSLPDEVLHIRDSNVDESMVVATLQIMKDWEKHIIREQKKKDPAAFKILEDSARQGDLGRLSHWRSTDFEIKGKKGEDIPGTLVKMVESVNKAAELAQIAGDSKQVVDAQHHSGSDSVSGGGDGGGNAS